MAKKQELVIIHPLVKGELPKADFWALLTFLKSNHIHYRLITTGINGAFSPAVNGCLIYLHITDITYLYKLKDSLFQFKKKNSLVITGGISILSIESDKILGTFKAIDIIARGPETEKVLANLVKSIFYQRIWQDVKGITYRHPGENKIIFNKSQPLSKHINHLSNLGIYNQGLQNAAVYRWYPIIISRGCDKNCMYCGFQESHRLAYDTGKTTWRKKTANKVVDEMEFLLSKGIDKFIFNCHRFFGSKKRHAASNTEIAREILNRGLKVKFKFIALAGDLKRNLDHLFILKEAGLEEILVGIDSGLPRFHEMYCTGSTVEDDIAVLRFLHEHELKFNISYIFYEPYLTLWEIKETIIFLKNIKKYFSHLAMPYSAILDSKIFNSILILRFGIPIIQKLKDDGLLIEYPGYSAHPATIFKDPAVTRIYRIYRQVNETILPRIRHFFYDKELVTSFSSLDLFPLMIMEKIVQWVENEKIEDWEKCVTVIEQFARIFFGSLIDNIFKDFPMYRNLDLYSWLKRSSEC